MRVRLIFSLNNKGAYIPFHHQNLLSGLIRDNMQDTELQSYTYYNFSGLKGQTKISRLGLHFYSTKVTLVLSSPNKTWIDTLLKSIFTQKTLQVGNLQLSPESVEQEAPPSFAPQTKYVCISPLVILNSENDDYQAKKFISPEENIFSDLLYETTMSQMESTKLYDSTQVANFYRFQIVPDKQYLEKIKKEDKKFARIYISQQGRVKYEFRGYTFPFVFFADEAVQKFVFECGLGCYTNEGFGMIDVGNMEQKNISTYSW